ESLGDLRRTVGLLGEPPEAGRAAPTPSATDLLALVAAYRSAGMQLRASVDGDLRRVPSGTGLELYRIAQEALANVAKHGSDAPADLEVRVEPDEVVLVVRNAARNGNMATPSGAGGSGIV